MKREPETTPPADGAAAIRFATSAQISPKPTGMFKPKSEESSLDKKPFAAALTPRKPAVTIKTDSGHSSVDVEAKVTSNKLTIPKAPSTPQSNVKTHAIGRSVYSAAIVQDVRVVQNKLKLQPI